MEVTDALATGGLSKGTVIAGEEGLSREVLSIEVMEVPDVVTWVTPGILVMTAFYSIKDNPDKQTEIVQSLIDIGAAGIVIKIGRFIEAIPDEMIELADDHGFPIIVIPKEVSYINILRPLFETLYDEKQVEIEKHNNPFYDIQTKNFSSLYDAIEAISEVAESAVYIEDLEGKLLYVTKNFRRDGWRTSSSFFSEPAGSIAKKILEERKHELHTNTYLNVDIQGFRDQFILPLVSKNKTFAIAHIPYKDKAKFKAVSENAMKHLSNQLSELFMNDQLYLQRKRLEDMELVESKMRQHESGKRKQLAIVYFHAEWMNGLIYPSSQFIDYASLVRRHLYELSQELDDSEVLIFERYNHFYGLVQYDHQSYSEMVKQWRAIIGQYNKGPNTDPITVSVSSPLSGETTLDSVIHSAAKMMQIGFKTKPDRNVYTYDQLGIYEILLNLTTDQSVKNYVHNILNPLEADQGDLIETLRVYLDENGNVSKSSERLYIHRRTLSYRLRKIEELLNMDLNDASNRFVLTFCFMIKELS